MLLLHLPATFCCKSKGSSSLDAFLARRLALAPRELIIPAHHVLLSVERGGRKSKSPSKEGIHGATDVCSAPWTPGSTLEDIDIMDKT